MRKKLLEICKIWQVKFGTFHEKLSETKKKFGYALNRAIEEICIFI